MKDDWREYEIAVSQLLAGKVLRWFPHLAKKDMAVYGKKKYVGSRGEYEIDASAEVLLGDVRLLFIVECKYWSSKVVQDVVLELVGKVQDLGANKGIIVSKEGFQLGAIRLARAHGIALWHFQPGRPRLFIPFVAAIDWEAVARSFETTWLDGCAEWTITQKTGPVTIVSLIGRKG